MCKEGNEIENWGCGESSLGVCGEKSWAMGEQTDVQIFMRFIGYSSSQKKNDCNRCCDSSFRDKKPMLNPHIV